MNENITWPSWPNLGPVEEKAVMEVVKSNQLFAAEKVAAFEKAFAEYVGVEYVKGVGNATEGLHLALAALGVGVGDEVIVPTYTWISSASCILMQNAVPVFADSSKDTLALSANTIRPLITNKTKAIIVVHLFGYPADMDPILALAKEKSIPVIEDASHVHGATYKGRKCGSMGKIGVFSLHQRKSLPVGDGGMVTTNDKEIAESVFRLRSFGDKELSYNYRMTEFAGALGLVRLKMLDEENEIRVRNAKQLSYGLQTVEGVSVRMPINGATSVFYRVLLDFEPEQFDCSVKEFVIEVAKTGVPLEMTWVPLHRHPHFNPKKSPARGCPWTWPLYDGKMREVPMYQSLKFPIVEDQCDNRIMELAIHPPVGKKEISYAINVIKEIANQHRRKQ